MKHRNKDVKIMVAGALAEVLRIYAPDPPYSPLLLVFCCCVPGALVTREPICDAGWSVCGGLRYDGATCAEVIKLFIQTLRGFENPDMTSDHPSYK